MDHPLYDSDFDIRKKGKTLDIIKSDCQCGGGERKKTQRKEHRLGGAVKIFSMILEWWTQGIIHFSKPTECPTGRVNGKV